MSQPAQVFTVGDPANGYVVIDNSASPITTTGGTVQVAGAALSTTQQGNWSPANQLNWDTTSPGAVSQSVNKFANGNIPDFVSSGKTFTTTAAVVVTPMIISYKLPS